MFKHITRCPQIVEIPIGDIIKRLILDYMHARMDQDEASSATVNREASMVKGMLSRAVEWDCIDHNPLAGFKMLPEAEKRKVNITPAKISELIKALDEPVASIIELAVYTGFRKENILSMQTEQISFHDLTTTGDIELTVKGGRTERFPLSPVAVEVIKRNIGRRKKGYVFVNPHTGKRFVSIHKSFNRIVRELGLTVNGTKLRIHDLRHLHATWLHQAGVSLDVIRPLLGHKDRETTDRYVTYDRLSYKDALTAIPNIRNGKNWQGHTQDHLPISPSTAVSH